MFILDLYKFCEGYKSFNRQHLAVFIFRHRESERMARASGMTHRQFTSSLSKEFCARMLMNGYLDGKNLSYWSTGSKNRPFRFEFNCLKGMGDEYTLQMANIGEMCDDELFGNSRNKNRHNQISPGQGGDKGGVEFSSNGNAQDINESWR